MVKEEIDTRKLKKYILLILISLLVAFLAVIMAQNAQDTADINNIFAIVVNNTDLYPAQRVQGVTYWANDSPIAVYIIFHVIGTGAAVNADSNFSINKTVVLDRDFRTTAGAGIHEHWGFYTIVPKGSNYSVTNSSNVAQIEWREYPILSGKNGTLSVNQTFIGSSFNATYDAYGSSKVNKTGDNMTGQLNFGDLPQWMARNLTTNKSVINVNSSLNTDSAASASLNFFGDANKERIQILSDTAPIYQGRAFSGDINSPGWPTNGQLLVRLDGSGYNASSGTIELRRASVDVVTAEAWSSGSEGAMFNFVVTPKGSTTPITPWRVNHDGNLTVLRAGNGIVLKSPDGTKCGFLNWTNTNTFATTAITCP